MSSAARADSRLKNPRVLGLLLAAAMLAAACSESAGDAPADPAAPTDTAPADPAAPAARPKPHSR